MIAEARRLNPGLRFQVGSMTDLDFDDGHFDGSAQQAFGEQVSVTFYPRRPDAVAMLLGRSGQS
jgi:hypothetical protein